MAAAGIVSLSVIPLHSHQLQIPGQSLNHRPTRLQEKQCLPATRRRLHVAELAERLGVRA